MIVMKFGGSSVASASAIKRVASIVQSQLHRTPAVVVSAMGKTTDELSAILKDSAAGKSYLAWKQIKDLREYHFAVAEDLLGSHELEAVDKYLRETFRDLHVRMSEICDGERALTPEEIDRSLSLGEQLSSTIVSSALRQLGIPSCHMDARRLIITDTRFNNAAPLYWQTYAKIRWSVPAAARHGVVVMGGFIGATENGQTTTLGRGGSDLTATIVGAAVNAEEIQIWKDVDGILTADPRIKKDALLVKQLSYVEAAALARAGAKVLHPETIAPAQRLRIPITLRNTFNPGAPGSTVSFAPDHSNSAKSIVCKENITLLEISSARPDVTIGECAQAIKMEPLAMTDSVLYLALDSNAPHPEFSAPAAACIQAHMYTGQALITVIGGQCPAVAAVVARFQGLILPGSDSERLLRAVVPHCHLTACLSELHHALFSAADPSVFVKPSPAPAPRRQDMHQPQPKERASRLRQALTLAGRAT